MAEGAALPKAGAVRRRVGWPWIADDRNGRPQFERMSPTPADCLKWPLFARSSRRSRRAAATDIDAPGDAPRLSIGRRASA